MHTNATLIILCLWAGLCVALPLWGPLVSRQGRIALPLLALFAIWFGATLPLEPHGPGFALAAVLSFPFGWFGHWLNPFSGHSTLAFTFVLITGALSAAINFYLIAWAITATCRWLGGIGLLVALLFTTSCDFASSPPRPPRQVCTQQLLQIDFAKQTWALEHTKTTNDTPVESDLFGTNAYIRQKVSCPVGGVYRLGRVGEKPTCSIPGHAL